MLAKKYCITSSINTNNTRKDALMEQRISDFAEKHLKTLHEGLSWACKKSFSNPKSEYAQRVFFLSLKTHLGNTKDFWYPLFKEITKREAVRGRLTDIDDRIWDEIYPVGAKIINNIYRRIMLKLSENTIIQYLLCTRYINRKNKNK